MDDPLKTHRREITVVFLDLRGFTAFTETAEPEEVMGVLREYHAAMGRIVLAHEGTLEHFAGDGIMIFFNDPVPLDEPELARGAHGARDAATRSRALAAGWKKRGYELGLGVGIAKATRRWARSASRAGATTARSARSPTSSARLCGEARPARSWCRSGSTARSRSASRPSMSAS